MPEFLIGMIVIPVSAGLPSLANEELLRQAEHAFHRGAQKQDQAEAFRDFRKSAQCYEELWRRQVRNAALCRNQANACMLAGDLAHAIVAYRRGLRLAPGDRELQAGLSFARAQVRYSSPGRFGRPPPDVWPPWLQRLLQGMKTPSLFLVYALGCLILTRWWMLRRGKLLAGSVLAFTLAAFLATLWILETKSKEEELSHPVVVIAEDGLYLRKGNGLLYPAKHEIPLNRGVEARLCFERGDWLQVELAGGETGWLPRPKVLLAFEQEQFFARQPRLHRFFRPGTAGVQFCYTAGSAQDHAESLWAGAQEDRSLTRVFRNARPFLETRIYWTGGRQGLK